MKKVPSIINLGLAAMIAAPMPASAQLRGRVPAGTVAPALGAGIAAPSVTLGAPALAAPTLSLGSALTPSLLPAPSIIPAAAAAGPAALKPVTSAASAAERMTNATNALAAMPNLGKAPVGAVHGSGMALEAALTGESLIASAPSADAVASPYAGGDAALAQTIVEKAETVKKIRAEIAKVIVGQEDMIDSIITAMIASEHVLLEGVPGVAKTQTVKAFSDAVEGQFERVQGTPDKLPSDILGSEIVQEDPATGEKAFKLVQGPVFTNILLVDEINRMMPKTQAALLEAMAEGRVTIARKTLDLPKPFMVLATQNPIEQEGVYRLPEAQQDRFMYKVLVPRPTMEQLKEIMNRFSKKEGQPKAGQVTSLDELVAIRKIAEQVHVDPAIDDYIVNIIEATHNPAKYGIDAKDAIESGASPRAAIFLLKAAKINALLNGRAWVSPQDVRDVAHRILRHRVTLGYQANNLTTDQVVDQILKKVGVPLPGARLVPPAKQPVK